MLLLLATSLIEYIELSTVIAVIIIISCGYLSFRISSRRPLYYNLFVVEMHTWTTRRMVQVLHLGQEFASPITWDRLVQRMRARAPRIQGEERMAISDTNIVIQSPNTVIDSPAPARSPDVDLITLWDIEMPPPGAGHVPDATRDSQYAAAAAIAILARGDDATLMSRVLQNNQALQNSIEMSPPSGERRNGPSRLDYVTTDVTYTTPSLNPHMQHQVTTTTSNVTQTQAPRNEIIGPLPDDDDDYPPTYETTDDDDDDSSVVVIDGSSWAGEGERQDEEGDESDANVPLVPTEEEREQVERQEEEEREQRAEREAREAEMAVLEGPSEGKILIRLKFMNDTEKDTYASLMDTVAKFKVDHFTDLANKVIRLIYRGQLLREDHRTLESYGLHEGCVMHCHISMTPYSTPGVATLAPIVNDFAPPRRRIRRSQRAPRDPTPTPPHEVQPVVERTRNEDFARRRAAQDRNVGQIYLLLSTMVPILSGIGLAFFRPDRIRDLLRPATLLTISQWVCNLLVDNGLLEQDDDEPDSHYQASTLFWIFGGQMIAVTVFLYYFPDLFHRLGLAIFCIFCLYFVFVVYSLQRRRQPDAQSQNEMIENQIVQESISLI
ncbi:hypothetical protein GCK72_009312 [Caenorhabditis remanei]|uniref:Ubiquitin-like domain-containing protein n=1 Tax=Caenorhabditis remanei TaxID=31234 RepID=A0A6A5GZY3_CAERE|nr:hypothetical protein GCK72_009312 [Caenorhabditis remanei]KAF1761058.1 hypothetical protein GCK72_009312 [Caenorhabditis remanei]